MSVELGTNAIGRDGGWQGESDRAIRTLTPGNAGRAKGPDFRRAVDGKRDHELMLRAPAPVLDSTQRSPGVEANARRQGCRGAIHRARLPTYCTLGDVHKLLPRAMASGPFAPIGVTVVRKAG